MNFLECKSECNIKYILHCNASYYKAIQEYLVSPHEGISRLELLTWVKRHTIAWLIRHQGHIVFEDDNTQSSTTHACVLSDLKFTHRLELCCCIVVRCIYDHPTTISPSDFQEHILSPSVSNDSSLLFLVVRCTPKITINRSPLFQQCLDYTRQCKEEFPTASVQAILLSWLNRTSVVFHCKQSAQNFTNEYVIRQCCEEDSYNEECIPICISPYLQEMEIQYNHSNSPPKASVSTESHECHCTSPSTLFRKKDPPNDSPGPAPNDSPNANHELVTSRSKKRKTSYPTRKRITNESSIRNHIHSPVHSYATRSRNNQITKIIMLASRSKTKIEYPASNHQPGTPPKLKDISPSSLEVHVPPIPTTIKERRIEEINQMIKFHQQLKLSGLVSQRDNWESWIDNHVNQPFADRPFMVLMTICMSSSTSDLQLSSIMPRIFACGMISATSVIDIAQQFGMNTMCSLLSESGRFYANTERIVNAADYFIQRHNGVIPRDITIHELTTLHGIGYKTACIILEAAFGRVDGIPADIHVIKWSAFLGWTFPKHTGLTVSKYLEAWVPHNQWSLVNPLFGALGQHSNTIVGRGILLTRLGETLHLDADMFQKVKTMINTYRPLK